MFPSDGSQKQSLQCELVRLGASCFGCGCGRRMSLVARSDVELRGVKSRLELFEAFPAWNRAAYLAWVQ